MDEDPLRRLLGGHSADVRDTALRLRALIDELAPEAMETVDQPDHLLAYGWSTRVRDLILAVAPHTSHVNLQLADGAILADPDLIVEGTGKRIRHVKCRSVADAERPAVRGLIQAQIEARPKPVEEGQ
ncbi:MAG: DUF1801 domain-containing protein [Candidatus Limnocylindrales bacterium]|nr:DUF1801 domain-containing protein [Chloroflexota bacterium]